MKLTVGLVVFEKAGMAASVAIAGHSGAAGLMPPPSESCCGRLCFRSGISVTLSKESVALFSKFGRELQTTFPPGRNVV